MIIYTLLSVFVFFFIFFIGTFINSEKYKLLFEDWALVISIILGILLYIRKKSKLPDFSLYILKGILKLGFGIILYTAASIFSIFMIMDYVPSKFKPIVSILTIIMLLGSMVALIMYSTRHEDKMIALVEQEFLDGKISEKEYTKNKNDKLKLAVILGNLALIVAVLKLLINLLAN
ncbi:hypothetical protein [Clostridium sp.]|uniref:hypothetical protein n=1 Tax=Clostridium sp. TaxID=1506 RepID=UPI003D6C8897